MTGFTRVYRYVNLLSLDIVAGAVVSALFFARVLEVTLRPLGLLALALTVWVIYTADHLKDARDIGKSASTLRHRFHQEHFKTLLIAAGLAVLLNVFIVFFLRKQIFVRGTVLAAGVGIYLIVQRYLKFLKEICIAFLYTCGVLLPSYTLTKVELVTAHYLLIIQFAMVAWLNLLIFSWFDREGDEKDKQTSFVTMLGERITRASIWCLIGGIFLVSVFSIYYSEMKPAVLIVATMGLVLAFIFVFRESFARHDYYRLLGDAVFLLPLLYMAWSSNP
jgi:4-hydroxybenzoate polyprenyltransferase